MTEQLKKQYIIEKMKPEDVEASTEMRLQSWLDTYINEEYGVTEEWIKERNERQRSSESAEQRVQALKEKGTGWVAKSSSGEIIGATTPYIDTNGVQHVGSMYVNKDYHGMGVGHSLMQKVIDWADPAKSIELTVASYNERAKEFYKKWGFVEVPDSETVFEEKIPEIKMIRKAVKNEF